MNKKGFTPFRDGNSKRGLTLNADVGAEEGTRIFYEKLLPPSCFRKKAGGISLTGFTLVELMVAIIILSIFLLAVGMILTSSSKFWNSGWDQVIVQQDASYAFARIEKIVRSGNSAVVLGGGSGLRVTVDGVTYTFQLSGNILQLVTGGNTENIVSGVQSVNFTITGNIVSVSLTLIDDNAQANFRTAVLLRNSL